MWLAKFNYHFKIIQSANSECVLIVQEISDLKMKVTKLCDTTHRHFHDNEISIPATVYRIRITTKNKQLNIAH
jgi:hypothetical protein